MNSNYSNETYDFLVKIIEVTDDILCVHDGLSRKWVPKRDIMTVPIRLDDVQPGDTVNILLLERLAKAYRFI